MLYKKYHRRHVSQFRIGREFRFNDGNGEVVHRIAGKPYIGSTTIWVNLWDLIFIHSGKLWHKDDIDWLN